MQLLEKLPVDLERVRTDPETDTRLKKRIFRTLIDEIMVDIDGDGSEVVLVVHWAGDIHTELRVPRRRRGQSGTGTDAKIVDAIRQLALVCSDKTIAGFLNRNGLATARGNRWSQMAITSLRNKREIAVHSEERRQAEGWMNLTAAAAHLEVSPKTLRRAAERGIIEAMHPLRDGPWVFNRRDLDDPEFRQRFESDRSEQSPPTGPDSRQLSLAISATYRLEAS